MKEDFLDKIKRLNLYDSTFGDLVQEIDELRSRSSSAWQPIATAPQDGTRIILWLGAPWNEMRVAQWYSPWEMWVEEFPADEYDDIYGIGSGLPTHWMLPNPPSKIRNCSLWPLRPYQEKGDKK